MADPKPIQDVAHPNKSAPSGNSKSVIVTHHSRMQDPMVNTTPEAETSIPVKSKKAAPSLKPLTAPLITSADGDKTELKEPKSEEEPESTKSTEVTAAPAKHVKLELKPLPATEESKEKASAEEEPPTPDKSIAEEEKSETTPVEANQEVVDAEEAKAEAALQKLVDSKQYFLPIDTLENRRSRRFVIMGILLSILMILLWLDVALDARLITIDGVKPLTNFFST